MKKCVTLSTAENNIVCIEVLIWDDRRYKLWDMAVWSWSSQVGDLRNCLKVNWCITFWVPK